MSPARRGSSGCLRRQHAEIPPQRARTAAIVGDRHHRGDRVAPVASLPRELGVRARPSRRRQPGTSPDRDDSGRGPRAPPASTRNRRGERQRRSDRDSNAGTGFMRRVSATGMPAMYCGAFRARPRRPASGSEVNARISKKSSTEDKEAVWQARCCISQVCYFRTLWRANLDNSSKRTL